DASGQNASERIGTGSTSVPAYASGTLGYVAPPTNLAAADAFLGASGYLLVSVDTSHLVPGTNRAPVSVQLVPNTDQLSIDAIDGTLLRRSTVSLFEGLARRPLGGEEWVGARAGAQLKAPDPYTTLPQTCLGATCSKFIAPAYTFTSSNPQIGTF